MNAVSGTLLGVGALVLFFSGRPLVAPFGLVGLGVAQWLLLAAPVLTALYLGGIDLRRALALHPVSARTLGGGTLVMLGALGMNSVVAWVQSFWIEVPEGLVEVLEGAMRAAGPGELALILLAAALTPAICEEIVFRGILLQSWKRWPAALAIGVNAALFGAIHWLPGSAVRVLPAAVSGAAIAWVVWRARSLWAGVWMHGINNGMLILATTVVAAPQPGATPSGLDPVELGPPSPIAVALFLVLLVAGGRLVRPLPTLRDSTSSTTSA
ncbi:MAG: type II CAAX endopeptidase family protein [Longimicrobiales bacterium]|nr:type II CAAX endopeptidase family protein [Longimicrobiales bacterium]